MKGNFEKIINDSRPVVVDFHALWCAPCRMQAPVLEEIASEMGNRIKVIKIDVDKNPELANRFSIRGVPTLMIFQQGKIKYKQAGLHSKSQIMNVVSNLK
jgi:thioredoxin 1